MSPPPLRAPGQLRHNPSGLPALHTEPPERLCAEASRLVRGTAPRPPHLGRRTRLPDLSAHLPPSVLPGLGSREVRGCRLAATCPPWFRLITWDLGSPVALSPPLPPGTPGWAALGADRRLSDVSPEQCSCPPQAALSDCRRERMEGHNPQLPRFPQAPLRCHPGTLTPQAPESTPNCGMPPGPRPAQGGAGCGRPNLGGRAGAACQDGTCWGSTTALDAG